MQVTIKRDLKDVIREKMQRYSTLLQGEARQYDDVNRGVIIGRYNELCEILRLVEGN